MEYLIQLFRKKMTLTQLDFIRSMEQRVNWEARLICIRGPRGTGKTTLLLQHIKRAFGDKLSQVLYVSLDNLYFMDNSLLELAEKFVQRGGSHLFLDEVHKYPNWSQTIKNIYDDYPELSVVFTGSSLLEILNARADLSRRALVYQMQGLSFREYLTIRTGQEFPVLTLEEILSRNEELSAQLAAQVKPFMYFEDYLKTGYYPFFLEGEEDYGSRLMETVNMILDIELPLLRKIETASIAKVKKLLMVIARSAPFIPNTTELAGIVGVARQTLLSYFNYLEESMLVSQLFKQARGLGLLQKPDKLFLENTNLMHVLAERNSDLGNIRETFVLNQLRHSHRVLFPATGDFLVDDRYTLEVGGRNKKRKQIQDVENSYIVADDIEYGTDRRIPIWLLGFLY